MFSSHMCVEQGFKMWDRGTEKVQCPEQRGELGKALFKHTLNERECTAFSFQSQARHVLSLKKHKLWRTKLYTWIFIDLFKMAQENHYAEVGEPVTRVHYVHWSKPRHSCKRRLHSPDTHDDMVRCKDNILSRRHQT